MLIDPERPWAKAFGRGAVLRNLGDPMAGSEMRVMIALQGPLSLEILLALGSDPVTSACISNLKRAELCHAVVGKIDLIVSRTGYTGEKIGFELFVQPDKAVQLWNALLQAGLPLH